jgi:glycosyltransferase involved in cell wall biosynthesis
MILRSDAFADPRPARCPPPTRGNVLALLPAHNEAETVRSVLEGVLNHVDQALVVDDGSDDRTGEEAARVGRTDVLRIPRTGKGGALRAGFQHAVETGYDWVLTLDSDGQHDPDEIPAFLAAAHVERVPMVVGSRRGDLGEMPWLRRATNLFMSWWLSRLARQEIPDSQNGYRLIATAVLREIPLTTCHFETESELLVKASRRGYRIGSVPIRTIYRKGGQSHIRKVPDTWRFLWLCARRPWSAPPAEPPPSPAVQSNLQ